MPDNHTPVEVVQDLLPCPFCGGSASVIGIANGMQVSCRGTTEHACWAKGPAIHHGPAGREACEAEAIAAWNTRLSTTTQPPALAESIARFVEQWNGDTHDGDTFLIAEAIREQFGSAATQPKPFCETCGEDVPEVLCATCAKWWADNWRMSYWRMS